jgi:hypothetical protein
MQTTRIAAVLLGLCGISVGGAGTAEAQTSPAPVIGGGVAYEQYRFGDPGTIGIESISLFTVPFAARAGLSRFLVIDLGGHYARGSMVRADGSTSEVSGPTDTQLRLSVPLGRDAVTLAAILILPTGHATHTEAEADVAGVIASDLLPFRISNWGSGGGAGASVAVARSFGRFGVGATVGYSVAREFAPLAEDELAYRPGNQLQLRLAADHRVGRAGKLALQLGYQRYGEDALDGQNLYRSGNRLQAIGSYTFAAGRRASGLAYTGVLHRERGTFFDRELVLPSQEVIVAGGGLRLPLGGVVLLPGLDTRFFRSSDGLGQGQVTGIGSSLEVPLAAVVLQPTVRGRFGSVIPHQGAETTIRGLELGLTLRLGSTRR